LGGWRIGRFHSNWAVGDRGLHGRKPTVFGYVSKSEFGWCAGVTALSCPQTTSLPARILVVGDDLLAGALASGLTAHGFSTLHVTHRQARVARGIRWRPSLVIVDAGSLGSAAGEALVAMVCRAGFRVCVIDACGEAERLRVWKGLGTAAFVPRNAPFDELFRTVNRLLRTGSPATSLRAIPASRPAAESSVAPPLEAFAVLTEREQFVLTELIEGHCAEEIARTSFVSISTVRSQIKSILQKLGVSSQLAAVALARRAGWSLEKPPV
jgi:DNA-binding NarL/FixJ family response regulator